VQILIHTKRSKANAVEKKLKEKFGTIFIEIIDHPKNLIVVRRDFASADESARFQNVTLSIRNVTNVSLIPVNQVEIKPDSVFLVYGRDEKPKDFLKKFLAENNLTGVELPEYPGGSLTLIEKLEQISLEASFAIIIFTPDDAGKLKTDKKYKQRARQNVYLEAGLFFGRLTRKKVLCFMKAEHYHDLEIASDLDGIHIQTFKRTLRGKKYKDLILRELKQAGFSIIKKKSTKRTKTKKKTTKRKKKSTKRKQKTRKRKR